MIEKIDVINNVLSRMNALVLELHIDKKKK
jgi:hypothetical protein